MRFTSLVVELVRARPRLVLWVVVVAVALLWFSLPVVFYAAPPGDVGSVLAYGRDYAVGTSYGPPLAFWMANIAFSLAGGHIVGVYLLSQLCFVLTFWTLFQLARAIVSSQQAVLAVLLTVTIVAFSYPGIAFGPSVAACPLWALTLLHSWRVMGEGRRTAWFALSFNIGLLLLTTPYAIVLLLLLVGFAVATSRGRQALRSTDSLFAALVVVVLVTPYLMWVIRVGAPVPLSLPALADAGERLIGWGELLGGALLNLSGIALLVLFNLRYFYRKPGQAPVIYRPPVDPFARSFVYFFAVAPVLSLTLIAAIFGADRTFDDQGVALLMTGLAVIVVAGERVYLHHETTLRTVWLVVVLAPAVGLVLAVLIQPWTGTEELKTSLPANAIGRFFDKAFETRVSRPLPAVTGDPELAELIGFAAPSRPRVVRDQSGQPDPANADDFAKTGGVVVWRAADTAGVPPGDIKTRFPNLVVEVPQIFDRRVNGRLPPLRIGWAIVRPQDASRVK
jgi:4-amino-4-deoxy-L-arabinose transferase-like glycosyltransferase